LTQHLNSYTFKIDVSCLDSNSIRVSQFKKDVYLIIGFVFSSFRTLIIGSFRYVLYNAYWQYFCRNKIENDHDVNLSLFLILLILILSKIEQQMHNEKIERVTQGIAHILLLFIVDCELSLVTATCGNNCTLNRNFLIINLLLDDEIKYTKHLRYPFTQKDEHGSKLFGGKVVNCCLYNDLYILSLSELMTFLFFQFQCLVDTAAVDCLWEMWVVVDDKTVAKPVDKLDTRTSLYLQLNRHALDKWHLCDQDEVHGSISGSGEPWNFDKLYEEVDSDGLYYNYHYYRCNLFVQLPISHYDKVLPHEGRLLYVTPAFAIDRLFAYVLKNCYTTLNLTLAPIRLKL